MFPGSGFRLLQCFILFFSLLMSSLSIGGTGILNAPMPVKCPDGSIGVADQIGICITSVETDGTGVLMIGAGAEYKVGIMASYVGVFAAYAPYSSTYITRMHLCPTSVEARCTISKSSISIDGAKKLNLTSSIPIKDQNPDAGGPNVNVPIPYSFSTCITLVDPEGTEWSSADAMSCSDGEHLPEVPAICYLNFGNDSLNIDLGTMERGTMATSPQSSQTVKTKISVLCTRDSGIDASYHFEFTPTTIAGEELVSTNLNGVAVALMDDGKLVNSSYTKNIKYYSGYDYINLEFGAVRDPAINLGDTGTGKFSANVVLVMTVQ